LLHLTFIVLHLPPSSFLFFICLPTSSFISLYLPPSSFIFLSSSFFLHRPSSSLLYVQKQKRNIVKEWIQAWMLHHADIDDPSGTLSYFLPCYPSFHPSFLPLVVMVVMVVMVVASCG
jgi:hypothetical protein